jgi:hypothetical protein
MMQPVRSAYQPPASSTFLSQQTGTTTGHCWSLHLARVCCSPSGYSWSRVGEDPSACGHAVISPALAPSHSWPRGRARTLPPTWLPSPGTERRVKISFISLRKKLPIIPTYHLYHVCIPPYTTGVIVVVYN